MISFTKMNHNFDKSQAVDCILPIYNEQNRVLGVVEKLLEVPQINQIICVDDGSTDNTPQQLERVFNQHPEQIRTVALAANTGKADAVKQGLQLVEAEHVLMFDADVHNLFSEELKEGIEVYLTDEQIRMLLFCEINELAISRLLRFNIVFSGNRLMRADDLQQVFMLEPERYQLETAINHYFSRFKQSVFYYNYSALNTHKIKKVGHIEGLKRELAMYKDVIEFAGPLEIIKQISTFARQECQ